LPTNAVTWDYLDLYMKGFTDWEVPTFIHRPMTFCNLQAFYQTAKGKSITWEEG
jgi:hypothetical protein